MAIKIAVIDLEDMRGATSPAWWREGRGNRAKNWSGIRNDLEVKARKAQEAADYVGPGSFWHGRAADYRRLASIAACALLDSEAN